MRLARTVAEIAALLGARVEGPADLRLAALAAPDQAGSEDLAPVFRGALAELAAGSRARCLLVAAGAALPPPAPGRARLVVEDVEAAIDALARACAPTPEAPAVGIDPSAHVQPEAEIAADAAIGPGAWVGRGARIGPRAVLAHGAHVGAGARIGADTVLHPHVVVADRCVVGARCVLHAGAVLGADGFGYRQDAAGRHLKVPQVGTVEIGDDVEIGAHSTVDRARFGTTRIGAGTKIDDHVHVGHNVRIGEHCAIAAMSVFAGSAVLEDRVLMGGNSGVVGHITVGAGSRIGGMTFVTQPLPPGSYVVGSPARAQPEWARQSAALARLPEALRRLRALESRREPHGA